VLLLLLPRLLLLLPPLAALVPCLCPLLPLPLTDHAPSLHPLLLLLLLLLLPMSRLWCQQ
jgi:hypothetical protein